jgi:dihydropteroate synthase
MGIVNLTPDSFSDGGSFAGVNQAIKAAAAMVNAGASLIDVGGESTRPGAESVSAAIELERVIPFVRRASEALSVPISIDTRKSTVARAALQAGASVVNDVSGLAHDPEMAALVADTGAGVVLMHMRGTPATMTSHARYEHVAADVAAELRKAVTRAKRAGVPDEAVVLDPGLGFAKDAGQSLELLSDLGPVRELGFPMLIGPSRKSFLGAVLHVPPEQRLPGTLAACVAAYLQGVRVFRVHDVEPVVQALDVAEAIMDAGRVDSGRER